MLPYPQIDPVALAIGPLTQFFLPWVSVRPRDRAFAVRPTEPLP